MKYRLKYSNLKYPDTRITRLLSVAIDQFTSYVEKELGYCFCKYEGDNLVKVNYTRQQLLEKFLIEYFGINQNKSDTGAK